MYLGRVSKVLVFVIVALFIGAGLVKRFHRTGTDVNFSQSVAKAEPAIGRSDGLISSNRLGNTIINEIDGSALERFDGLPSDVESRMTSEEKAAYQTLVFIKACECDLDADIFKDRSYQFIIVNKDGSLRNSYVRDTATFLELRKKLKQVDLKDKKDLGPLFKKISHKETESS